MSVRDRIGQVLRDGFGVEGWEGPCNPQNLPGWDSMKQVHLLAAVEEEFGLTLTAEEQVALMDGEDLVNLLEKRGS